jgi:hypothetical protein
LVVLVAVEQALILFQDYKDREMLAQAAKAMAAEAVAVLVRLLLPPFLELVAREERV